MGLRAEGRGQRAWSIEHGAWGMENGGRNMAKNPFFISQSTMEIRKNVECGINPFLL
jgi:hypothetical protein